MAPAGEVSVAFVTTAAVACVALLEEANASAVFTLADHAVYVLCAPSTAAVWLHLWQALLDPEFEEKGVLLESVRLLLLWNHPFSATNTVTGP